VFGLNELRQTRFYQEAKQEGRQEGIEKGRLEVKLEAVPHLLVLEFTVEQIAQALNLQVEQVMQVAQKINNQGNQD
jgi:predicted transposase/invertase (TIGR01784 family)